MSANCKPIRLDVLGGSLDDEAADDGGGGGVAESFGVPKTLP
jgi:hypothetical protein